MDLSSIVKILGLNRLFFLLSTLYQSPPPYLLITLKINSESKIICGIPTTVL